MFPSACCSPALQHHCTVPMYSCAVTALAIHPVTNNLVIAYSDQQVGAVPVPALMASGPSLCLPLALKLSGPMRKLQLWQEQGPTVYLTAWLEPGLPCTSMRGKPERTRTREPPHLPSPASPVV